jgi:hypothetical protein
MGDEPVGGDQRMLNRSLGEIRMASTAGTEGG